MDQLLPWASLVLSLGTLAFHIVSWRQKANADKLASLDGRMTMEMTSQHHRLGILEDRVIVVEAELKHLPDKETTHRMEIAIMDLRAQVGVIAERMGPVAATSARLQEFMLERAER